MGLDFLRNQGACRMGSYEDQPLLLTNGGEATEPDEAVQLDYERNPDQWTPLSVNCDVPEAWPHRPLRYVDGKDVGRTVAWLRTRGGHPVPVRLSEIGAVVLRSVGGELRREFSAVERVVTMMVDPFPWSEVEAFAAALKERGFRLLPAELPEEGPSYDFERMRKTTQNASTTEMGRLEKRSLARHPEVPTVVDGRLDPRKGAFDDRSHLTVGVIKTHWQNYLHPRGWRVYYDLQPGQRTPAFGLRCRNLEVVSWYLRLDGAHGEMPNWGVVRVEIPRRFCLNGSGFGPADVDRLSRLLCDYRCRDHGYGRAPVSLHPIQRAEESLGALFTGAETLIQRFYRMTEL